MSYGSSLGSGGNVAATASGKTGCSAVITMEVPTSGSNGTTSAVTGGNVAAEASAGAASSGGAGTGIDGEHAPTLQRRLEQETAQVLGEYFHRVVLGTLGQFAANFALQAGEQQPGQSVLGHLVQELGVRMVRQRQFIGQSSLH